MRDGSNPRVTSSRLREMIQQERAASSKGYNLNVRLTERDRVRLVAAAKRASVTVTGLARAILPAGLADLLDADGKKGGTK